MNRFFAVQLSLDWWDERGRAALEFYKIAWPQGWELVPSEYQSPTMPDNKLYSLKLSSLGLAGAGDYGTVY